jgi:hypothetical protein
VSSSRGGASAAAADGRRHIRTSQILAGFIRPDAPADATVLFGDLIERLDQRAFGIVLVLLALPCAIPGPPAITSFIGVPLAMVGVQMAMRRPVPWLPRRLRDYRLSQAAVNRFVAKALPFVERLEAVSRPRWESITFGTAERLLGLLIAVLGLCIMVPLPLSNMPPGVSITIMGLALIERDGVLLTLGLAAAAVALVIMVGVLQLAFALVGGFIGSLAGG